MAATQASKAAFRFKQFFVAHDRSALKLCTDSSLFGAYVARRVLLSATPPHEQASSSATSSSAFASALCSFPSIGQPGSILDIGTGCGVLSLIVAQESPGSVIHGVEIDELSAEQCANNMKASPWADRLQVFHTTIQEFSQRPENLSRYDLVISNPPFYPVERYAEIPDRRKNNAMRTDTLPFDALLDSVARVLDPAGHFFVLLPPREAQELSDLAANYELVGTEEMRIRDQPLKPPHRSIVRFQKSSSSIAAAATVEPIHFSIKTETLEYTPDFIDLLSTYYLSFFNPQASIPAPRFVSPD